MSSTTNTAGSNVGTRSRSVQRARSDKRAALGFLTPSMLGLTIFILFPSILAAITSLFAWPTFGDIEFIGLENYKKIFSQGATFGPALKNTFLFALIIVPINLVATLGVAFWVARSRFRKLYRVLFFLPVVTPTVATAIIWKMMYQPNGVVDYVGSLFGLNIGGALSSTSTALVAVSFVVLWQGLGYNTLIFSAAIDQLPGDILEASDLDGAGTLRKLLQIKLPLMSPSIFFAMTITVIQIMQIFNEPFIMTAGGPGNATTTVVMDIYQTAFQSGQLGAASAPAMVLFALIVIMTLVQWAGQKKWVHYD